VEGSVINTLQSFGKIFPKGLIFSPKLKNDLVGIFDIAGDAVLTLLLTLLAMHYFFLQPFIFFLQALDLRVRVRVRVRVGVRVRVRVGVKVRVRNTCKFNLLPSSEPMTP
jgi:hypothetical protein